MTRKWTIVLLVLLPFGPVALWGLHLPDAAYSSLQVAQQAVNQAGLFPLGIVDFQPLSTPLFPIGVAFLAQFGVEPSLVAVLLSTLGWGVAALLIWWCGRRLDRAQGALVAAVLYSFNPWVVTTLGQATGWIIALFWLLLNFGLRRRYVVTVTGALFLLSLFFHPSQGFRWPADLIPPLAWSLLLFAAGMGGLWLAGWLAANGAERLSARQVTALVLGLFFVAAGAWQAIRLGEQFDARPLAQWAAEDEVGAWLRSNSDPEATLLASARTAYSAGRRRVAATPHSLQELLPDDAPDYVVSSDTLPWQLLREAIWFRLYYEPVQIFGATPDNPRRLALWRYRPPLEGLGPVTLLNARVPDRLSLLGYQLAPQPAQPGSQSTLTLYLQRPEATIVEPGRFDAVLRLSSPVDGTVSREWRKPLPQGLAPEAWAPGQVIAEQIQFPIQAGMEPGAYPLSMSLIGEGETEFWPVSFNNDVNRLDRIPLGYVILPWQGSSAGAAPVRAGFEQGITLDSVVLGDAQRGETLEASLYWTAGQVVDAAYAVFVHLVDEEGALVANHDGPPAAGIFPTDAWLPGMTIPDAHPLPIPESLAPGRYELRAGLYDPQSGKRLALLSLDGMPAAGDYAPLGSVVID
jgi:hypothetical protein